VAALVARAAFAHINECVCTDVASRSPPRYRRCAYHLDLRVADIAALQRQTIRVTDEKGTPAEYGGVPVAEILEKAGAPLGKEMKGPNMGVGLVARAPDGYHVLFSLAEFDPAFSDRVVLLADRRDGKPLDNHEGPLRIVVPGDQRHARWIRGVTTLEVVKVH